MWEVSTHKQKMQKALWICVAVSELPGTWKFSDWITWVPSHYWPPVKVHVTQYVITSPYLWAHSLSSNQRPKFRTDLRLGERERGQRPEVSSTSLSWRAAPSAKRAACQVQRTAVRTWVFGRKKLLPKNKLGNPKKIWVTNVISQAPN